MVMQGEESQVTEERPHPFAPRTVGRSRANRCPGWCSADCLTGAVCLTAIFFLVAGGCVQSRAPEEMDTEGKWVAEKATHRFPADFHKRGAVLRHDFEVVNDTDMSVRFEHVRTSCTCTTADLSAKTLGPHEKAVLSVSLTTTSLHGIQGASSVLIDSKGRPWIYRMTAMSYSPMQFSGGGLRSYVSLDVSNPGEQATGEVEIHTFGRPGGEPPYVDVLGDVPEPIHVQPRVSCVTTFPDGFQRRTTILTFKLAEQSVSGMRKSCVGISCLADGKLVEGTVVLTWETRSMYRVQPNHLYLGAFQGTEGIVCGDVVLERVDGMPVEISTVQVHNPAVVAKVVDPNSKKTHVLRLSVDIDQLDGPLYDDVRVEMNDSTNQVIVIPLSLFL